MTYKNSHVFRRSSKEELPLFDSAQGIWIKDEKGKRYMDASGGAVVVNVGHAREEIAKAVQEQILSGSYAHPTMFTSRPVEDLAQALTVHAPKGINRFYFLTSGSEANEAAIKMARQIHLAAGRTQKFKLIARWKSYHGLTLGALSAMGRTTFRAPFAPMLTDVEHIAPPYCLRCYYGLTHPECGLRCAHALEDAIVALGPDTVSAFLAETVSGATIAAVPPPMGYWKVIREICDHYDVMLIHDEVMSGMGRTGRWFASQRYGVSPDLVTMGKGISGGTVPLSALGVRGEHHQALVDSSGFTHGGTYSHHAVAASAGLATVKILEDNSLVERAAEQGRKLGAMLKERLEGHPHVAQVRGVGMLWGIEFVKYQKGLTPYPRSEQVTERLWQNLFERGIIVYKSTGLAGVDGDGLVIAPPFTIEKDDMTTLADQLVEAMDEVLV